MTELGVFTVGHSDQDAEAFVALLKRHAISAVVDVRSQPSSAWVPQFNRVPLKSLLKDNGIRYAFMGKELGVRSTDPSHYEAGKVVYGKLAASAHFRDGLDRVKRASASERLAIMCSEQDPLACHRSVLIATALEEADVDVTHILRSGELMPQADLLERLLREEKLAQPNLFMPHEERIKEALAKREEAIAWREPLAAGSRRSG